MKKFIVNKNVNHNGNIYAKDSVIAPSAEGFKVLLESGHIYEVAEVESAPVAESESAPVAESESAPVAEIEDGQAFAIESEPQEKSVEQPAPGKKSRK